MKKIILISLFGLMFSQAEVTSKVYDFYLYRGENNFDLTELTGYDLESAQISVFGVSSDFDNIEFNIQFQCTDASDRTLYTYNNGRIIGYSFSIYYQNNSCSLDLGSSNSDIAGNIKLLVTAEFPIEDTGYIEEGFDFCLVPGNNLVAFPCDNPVSVETAIPELAQAEIEQIIGAGQAATNLNGQFIGSLSNFTPGAGYWFKSSSSMCFNYACAE